jgi:hypothetical protein
MIREKTDFVNKFLVTLYPSEVKLKRIQGIKGWRGQAKERFVNSSNT